MTIGFVKPWPGSTPLPHPSALAASSAPATASAPMPVAPWQLQRLAPCVAILICLSLLLAVVTTPPTAFAAFGGYATLLIGLLALAGAAPGPIARRFAAFLPFLVCMTLPLLWMTPPPEWTPPPAVAPLGPGALLAFNVAVKALLGLGTLLLLTALLPFEALLSGLADLRVPKRLLTLLQLTHRYGAVLRAEAARMQRARLARGYRLRGRWLLAVQSSGHLIGALFVRSAERAERLHQAMLARGFDGVSLTGVPAEDDSAAAATAPIRGQDLAWLTAVTLLLILLRGWVA